MSENPRAGGVSPSSESKSQITKSTNVQGEKMNVSDQAEIVNPLLLCLFILFRLLMTPTLGRATFSTQSSDSKANFFWSTLTDTSINHVLPAI